MGLKLIGIKEARKKELDRIKEHPRETYDSVVKRLLDDRRNGSEGTPGA